MITVNTILDFTRPNDVVLHAKQNDRLSRTITAQLVSNDTAMTGFDDYAAIIRYRKPDGTGGAYDVDDNDDPAVAVSGSVATLTLAEQVLTVPGNVDMELNFYNSDGEKVTSFRWILAVEESAYDDGGIVSSDYFNILTAQIASAIQAAEDAAESAEAAEDAAESIVVDTALSPTSENPVQNKVVYQALQNAGSDLDEIRAGAALGATALQEHQSLAAYRTASAQDAIDATKLGDAPADGKRYLRKSGAWAEAPSFSNPNLLDNGWFTVNQRGQNSYGTGYGFDRWTVSGSGATISKNESGGVTLTSASAIAYCHNRLEQSLVNSLIGKTVTVSALLDDDTLLQASGTVSITSGDTTVISLIDSDHHFRMYLVTNDSNDYYGRFTLRADAGYSVTVKAAKLELGSVSTLSDDAVPDYTTEMLKCQRYFWQTSNYSMPVRIGQYDANAMYAVVSLPAPLRVANPSVSGTLSVKGADGSDVDGFSFSTEGGTEGALCIKATKTGHGLTDGMISFAGMQITADL